MPGFLSGTTFPGSWRTGYLNTWISIDSSMGADKHPQLLSFLIGQHQVFARVLGFAWISKTAFFWNSWFRERPPSQAPAGKW